LLLCGSACLCVAQEMVRLHTTTTQSPDPRYHEMVHLSAVEAPRRPGAGPGLEQDMDMDMEQPLLRPPAAAPAPRWPSWVDETSGAKAGGRQRPGVVGREEDGWDPVPRVRLSHTAPAAQNLHACARVCCVLVVLVVMTVSVLLGLYSPHYPQLGICNTELDWGSILRGLVKMKVEAEAEVLVSVYNPNLIAMDLKHLSGVMKHDGQQIGTLEAGGARGGFLIGALSVSDILVTTRFMMTSVQKSVQLEAEYQMGSLLLMVDLSLEGALLIGSHQVSPFQYGLSNYFIHVNEYSSDDNRQLCNCYNPG